MRMYIKRIGLVLMASAFLLALLFIAAPYGAVTTAMMRGTVEVFGIGAVLWVVCGDRWE